MMAGTRILRIACTLLLLDGASAAAQQVEFSLAPAYVPVRALGNLAWGVPIEEAPGFAAVIDSPMAVGAAVAVAPTITLHGPRNLSHEIFYSYASPRLVVFENRGQVFVLDPDGVLVDQEPVTDGTRYTEALAVRQAGYNLLWHAGSRDRVLWPYLTIGTALTSFEFKDTPRPPAGLFNVALRDVGGIVAAIRTGRTNPLEGGTVYRIGLTYGAGMRIRVTRLLGLRIDGRETLMRDPDFYNRQSMALNAGGIFTGQVVGTYRRHLLSVGLAVGF